MMTEAQRVAWFTYHAPTSDEQCAETLYNSWSEQPGWIPWVPGGNSTKQDEARTMTHGQASGPKYAAIRAAEFECHKAFAALAARAYPLETPETPPLTLADCNEVNRLTLAFADVVDANAPDSADKSAALRCIRLARNAANDSVAANALMYPTHIDSMKEASRQLVLARWQANSAIACGGL